MSNDPNSPDFDPLARLEALERGEEIPPPDPVWQAERIARMAQQPPLVDPEEVARMRHAAEHPETPLKGSLVVTTADTSCDWCRGRGLDEGACALDATPEGTWVVLGIVSGGTYHLDCARELGWVPTEKAAEALEKYPNGPYA